MRVNDKRIGKRRKREAKRGRMKQSIKANEGTRKENDESKVKVAVRRAKMQRKIMRDRQREIIKTGTQRVMKDVVLKRNRSSTLSTLQKRRIKT